MYASGWKMDFKFSHSHASLTRPSQIRPYLYVHQGLATCRYEGHPSASSLSLYRSSTRLSGPLLRKALSGLDPAGNECKSGIVSNASTPLS